MFLLLGALGFLGQSIMCEILKRDEKIIILVRDIPDKSKQLKRLEMFLNTFGLKNKRDNINIIFGDVTKENLGISNIYDICDDIHYIINCASSVSFNLTFSDAYKFNVTSVKKIISFARLCPKLQLLLHTSTAYVQSYRDTSSPREHIGMNEDHFNNYTRTKNIAEHLLEQCLNETFKIHICRPSIIGASYETPYCGWTHGYGGFFSVGLLFNLRLLFFIHENWKNINIVPVDYVSKCILNSIDDIDEHPLSYSTLSSSYAFLTPMRKKLFHVQFKCLNTMKMCYDYTFRIPLSYFSIGRLANKIWDHVIVTYSSTKFTFYASSKVEDLFKNYDHEKWMFEQERDLKRRSMELVTNFKLPWIGIFQTITLLCVVYVFFNTLINSYHTSF